MTVLEELTFACSPYPMVDLNAAYVPNSGQHHSKPTTCRKVFSRGDCEAFYRGLSVDGNRHQCPHGFSVWPMQIGGARVAITGFIGAPRAGGALERLRAKEHPHNRVDAEIVKRWSNNVAKLVRRGDAERDAEFARWLEALHEIRRFNQIVKTNMERVCNAHSPHDPDAAPADLVRAPKAASLISVQLDGLDLLANPASSMSFSPRRWVFYKTVDKIVRMYRVVADGRNVRIKFSGASVSEALMDERTIHIIPSVFIDNAVKYSRPGDTVDVHVCDEGKTAVITLTVSSTDPVATEAEQRDLFLKRGRGSSARAVAEGSGVGLTLAKIVADQHKGLIFATQTHIGGGRSHWSFAFQIPRVSWSK